MFKKTVEIVSETGLHARPAAKLVEVAKGFQSDIHLVGDNILIDCKKPVSVLTGNIQKGTILQLQVSGVDEEQAGETIADLLINIEGWLRK